MFSFQKVKMSKEFCFPSLEVGTEAIAISTVALGVRAGSLFKILVAREQIIGASSNQAPVRQQLSYSDASVWFGTRTLRKNSWTVQKNQQANPLLSSLFYYHLPCYSLCFPLRRLVSG